MLGLPEFQPPLTPVVGISARGLTRSCNASDGRDYFSSVVARVKIIVFANVEATERLRQGRLFRYSLSYAADKRMPQWNFPTKSK